MLTPNNDILFTFMYMTCLYYKPSKTNKLKIKRVFEDIPFFIHEKDIFFNIIVSNPITLHYHRSSITEYSYIIYKEYHNKIKQPYMEYPEYIEHYNHLLFHNETKAQKAQRKRIVKIVLFLIICVYFICISKIGSLS